MSTHNEQVQPTPFDVAQPTQQPPSEESRPPSGPAPWVLPALGGLLVLALVVIFWLPERVNTPVPEPQPDQAGQQPAAAGKAGSGAPAGQPAATTPDASPWSEAQAAKLRKEAQEVLAQLLDIQAIVEERGVERWAPEDFAAATAFATNGDEQYRARQYEDAKTSYAAGLAAMQALQDAIPQEMARRLAAAQQGIENGDLEAVGSALEMASLIEPENAELAKLQQRAQSLPEVLAKLEEAAAIEAGGDLAGAEQVLQQATTLDPQHLRARAELQRVSDAYLEQRFNDAMSDGYAALDAGKFDAARKSFRAASGLQSGSSEAASALQEVAAAETAYRLSTLKQRGRRLEQQEKWQDAVDTYNQALKIDKNVLFASEGLGRSTARARLDKQFRTALNEPERLSDKAVASATEQLMRQARQIQPRGPVLEQQLSRLERSLQQANTPISVTLRSDKETDVIVYKVARLGRFEQKELSLRPGTYTAVGTRNGYRDVRRSFTINHDSAPPLVTIACTEPI